jgi:adenosylcobinamide-GDP ribazoletransferase
VNLESPGSRQPPPPIVDRGFAKGLHAFIAAVQFLTRVPVPGGMHRPGVSTSLLADATVCFPLVGTLIGWATGCVVLGADGLWPGLVAVLLGLVFEALLTGGFHEDAVADCCDAFGGGWTREDVLRILKDSRVGSYGVLGLALALSLRATCLVSMDAGAFLPAIVASATLGRWSILLLMTLVPPVPKREGLAKDVGERVTVNRLGWATCLAIPGVIAFGWQFPERLVVAWLVVSVAMWVWGRYVQSRLGGITGDCLGTGCYLGQLIVLLIAVAEVS